jgi:hypothetical protein
MQDPNQVEVIMAYLNSIPSQKKENRTIIFKALLQAGFDPTVPLPKNDTGWLSSTNFLIYISRVNDYPEILAYHGFYDVNDHYKTMSGSIASEKLEQAIRLREQMLDKMQRHVPVKGRKKTTDLTVQERFQLSELCSKTQLLRDALQGKFSGHDKELQDKELHERIEIHKKFKQACLDGNLEQAKQLLSHDIDIDGLSVEKGDKKNFPLVNYACMTGNVKLLQLLIDNGAHLNIGHDVVDFSEPSWLPPIFDSAIYSIPNKQEIIALLIKAQADPNERFGQNIWSGCIVSRLTETETDEMFTVLKYLLSAGLDINKNLGTSLTYSLLNSTIRYLNSANPATRKKGVELSKLLIYLGINMSEESKNELKRLSDTPDELSELLTTVLSAKKRYDQIYSQWLKKHLEEESSLKKLSTDLINIISDMSEIALTPKQRIEIAEKCLQAEAVAASF